MNTLKKLVFYSFSLLLHLFSWTSQALESPTFHIVDTNAYLSTSDVCNSTFTTATGSKNKRSSTFKIMDRFGPHISNKTRSKLSLRDIILRDQSRVDSIHKLSRPSNLDSAKSYRPILPPESFNASTYVVTIELGTPVQPISFLFSLNAVQTFVQCAPWYNESYFFDSTTSSTFSNITCDAPECIYFFDAYGLTRDCSADMPCILSHVYDDNPLVAYSKDTLTVMSTPTDDVIPDFVFGCTGRMMDLNGSTIAGILGFGRDKYSFISQFNKVFSYCLPQNATQLGYLRFGDEDAYNNTMMTDLANCPIDYPWVAYCIDITSIAVGRDKLPINGSISAVIDFETAFTYLPPEAYAQLRTEFKQQMANYTPAPSYDPFDTCYDTRNSSIIKVPTVSFTIGDLPVPMDPSGILFPIDNTTVSCLAFIGQSTPDNVAIFGNRQQQGLKVMFDVSGGKIGFRQGGDCVPG